LSIEDKKKYKKILKETSVQIFEQYMEKQYNYRRKKYVNPLVEVVAMIPKNELALMAESLVKLTSFKKRVTMEEETVAEPIDVALISKGDGLIWIKRKHYFKPELNPQFFANYYRRCENAE
jgi:hypothetical protein